MNPTSSVAGSSAFTEIKQPTPTLSDRVAAAAQKTTHAVSKLFKSIGETLTATFPRKVVTTVACLYVGMEISKALAHRYYGAPIEGIQDGPEDLFSYYNQAAALGKMLMDGVSSSLAAAAGLFSRPAPQAYKVDLNNQCAWEDRPAEEFPVNHARSFGFDRPFFGNESRLEVLP